MERSKLTEFLQTYLNTEDFNDYCPNGLQVEGRNEVKKIVTAVSASVELFKKAVEVGADTILVHHGIIWNFERPLYKGGYRERVRWLIENNLNLYGFHLPLDAHPEVGNSAQLCRLLGIQNIEPFGEYEGQNTGMRGEITSTGKDRFFEKISRVVNREPLIFDYGPEMIEKVGIITGGAQKYIHQAVAGDLDVFITGEVSEHIMHYAQEEKIHFVSAGHYATETLGIKALGEMLAGKFGLDVTFIDIPNPV